VATVEERLAYLEGKVEEHSRGYADIRDGLQHLDQRLTFLDQKVDRFRDELAAKIEALDQRLSGRIEALDQKVSKQFIWLVGIQIMVLLAVIGALLGK
jgi:chromosome segregation ATPase